VYFVVIALFAIAVSSSVAMVFSCVCSLELRCELRSEC